MIVTKRMISVTFNDGLTGYVDLTYDAIGLDENNEPIYEGAIVEAVCVNLSPIYTLNVSFKHNSGQAVFERSLGPLGTETLLPGGNITDVLDIPKLSVWTS